MKFEDLSNSEEVLEECPDCGENAWDGYICHDCGYKDIGE